MERPELDFKQLAEDFSRQSTRAQATLMFKLIECLGPMVTRSALKYCLRRLDVINEQLPDSHPGKKKFLSYGADNRRKAGERRNKAVSKGRAIDMVGTSDTASSQVFDSERW